ncbi:MAG: GTP cyclohydrolase FolE2 [Oxalicibacterium faecigallinarum]|uniref:GTP cyclohydrolase FolE2 n=1 Tax=Oxalicibacterium faecigallinarum TaxID=573741 RepID=A0A8J3F2F4_9BURK|nr:GTP cyclohydrolase FolE2 [Oxalicibacterium faecigallinarum]MDQ7970680.1 GTP cyclohydrolase FolE2 [Oxalicibacterium faecigallinarum]GGI21215.1 GTP cyclohydrolase FolE2 [Oxalicibacterium faecigallinarum]
MNTRDPGINALPDVQSTPDTRHIPIQRVGVKGVRYPVSVKTASGVQPSVGTWNMYVHLSEQEKGTHMSRFIALLEDNAQPFDVAVFSELMRKMLALLEAEAGRIEVTLPYFINKTAPVSGVQSLMDYEVGLIADHRNGKTEITLKVLVPVTSLCPCSKKISAYGAHNQRSHITVQAVMDGDFVVDDLIAKIEAQASCELWGLLKRPDEKYVTERAYENPKFVEDLVRDVAVMLNNEAAVVAYTLEAENFESIHNHSAYALIEKDKRVG